MISIIIDVSWLQTKLTAEQRENEIVSVNQSKCEWFCFSVSILKYVVQSAVNTL